MVLLLRTADQVARMCYLRIKRSTEEAWSTSSARKARKLAVKIWEGTKYKLGFRKGWLTGEIKRTRGQQNATAKLKRFLDLARYHVVPSWLNALRIVLFVVALYAALLILEGNHSRSNSDSTSTDSPLTIIWQVQVALTATLLPILVFSISFSRDEATRALRTTEILVYYTGVFPAIVIALTSAFCLGVSTLWCSHYSTNHIPHFVLLASTLIVIAFSYIQALKLLFEPNVIRDKSIELLKTKMRRSMKRSMDARIGNSILLARMAAHGVTYNPFFLIAKRQHAYHRHLTPTSGVIVDINLSILDSVVRALNSCFGSRDMRADDPNTISGRDPHLPSNIDYRDSTQSEKYVIVLGALLSEPIEEGSSALFGLKKSVFSEELYDNYAASINRSFFIAKDGKHQHDIVEQAIDFLCASTITAIRAEDSILVLNNLGIIEELVSVNMGEVVAFTTTQDTQNAIDYQESFLRDDWQQMRWLQRALSDILHTAFNRDNDEALHELLYTLTRIAKIAFKHNDYYFYMQFVDWLPTIYIQSIRHKNPKIRTDIPPLCLESLDALCKYTLGYEFEATSNIEDMEAIAGFMMGSALIYSELLKRAYDARDLGAFSDVGKALASQYSTLDIHIDGVLSAESNAAFAAAQRAQLSEIEKYQLLAFFGIGSWILHGATNSEISAPEATNYIASIPYDSSLEDLTRLYYESREQRTIEAFRWDRWEMAKFPEGRVVSIDCRFSHSRFFCFWALKLLETMSDDAIARITLPHDRSLKYSGRDEIMGMLDSFESNAKLSSPLIGRAALDKIPVLRSLIFQALAAYEDAEIDNLIDAPLDDDKVAKFKEDFVSRWRDMATMRSLFRRMGTYTTEPLLEEKTLFIGFNKFDHKELYAQDQSIANSGWGANYGRPVADAENEQALSMLSNSIKPVNDAPMNPKSALQAVSKAIKELTGNGFSPSLILLTDGWCLDSVLHSESDYKPSPTNPVGSNGAESMGLLSEIPVYRICHSRCPKCIFILDVSKAVEWVQYIPKIEEGEELLAEHFRFLLKAFGEKEAADQLQKQPGLEEDSETGTKRTKTEAIRYVRQLVHLKILEKFELRVIDPMAGRKIELPKEND